MMRSFALPLALLIAGCGGHSNVQIAGSGVPTATTLPAGTAVGGGSLSANIQGGSTAGALIGIGILSVTVFGESYNGGLRYRANPFAVIQPTTTAPKLDETRRVLEQDCTKPIEDWSANLKCR